MPQAPSQVVTPPLSPAELFSGTSQSIVRIETDFGIGTGFVILLDSRPCIITCKHVVEDPWADFPLVSPSPPSPHYLKVGFGADQLFELSDYRGVKNVDLAMLEIPVGLKIKTLALRRTPVKAGEPVYAIGFPVGLERSITQGIVNAVYSDYLQFQAPISNGNSGGPLLDIHGQVIGIVTMGLLTSQGAPLVQNLNFALPVSAIPLHRPKND